MQLNLDQKRCKEQDFGPSQRFWVYVGCVRPRFLILAFFAFFGGTKNHRKSKNPPKSPKILIFGTFWPHKNAKMTKIKNRGLTRPAYAQNLQLDQKSCSQHHFWPRTFDFGEITENLVQSSRFVWKPLYFQNFERTLLGNGESFFNSVKSVWSSSRSSLI